MNIAFRVDAYEAIGLGHIMRCLNLAQSLKKQKINIFFISSIDNNKIIKKIKQADIELLRINKNYSNKNLEKTWVKKNQLEDAKETIDLIKSKNIFWLIVDNYKLNFIWEKEASKYVKKIFVIDDLFQSKHYCDLILNQNFVEKKNLDKILCKKETKILIGPKYALINQNIKKIKLVNNLKNIIIFFGGKLQVKIIGEILDFLKKKKFSLKILVMKNSSKLELIKKKYKKFKNIKFLILPKNYENLLSNSQFFIGAGGSSVFERLFAGVPNYIFCVSKNQKNNCDFIKKKNLAFMKSINTQTNLKYFKNNFSKILSNKEKLLKMSRRGISCVDGQGSKRILKILTSK
jgi:UDP-2,4-diacetamido-2,4,6-trideoxy-beta-L-altropyranose hydrolase